MSGINDVEGKIYKELQDKYNESDSGRVHNDLKLDSVLSDTIDHITYDVEANRNPSSIEDNLNRIFNLQHEYNVKNNLRRNTAAKSSQVKSDVNALD